jgi:hypothetical protein
MKSAEFVKQLKKKFDTIRLEIVAKKIGVSVQTLKKWETSNTEIEPFSLVNAMFKAREAAIVESQFHMIKPIVEFYPIDATESKQGANYELFPKNSKHQMEKGLLDNLSKTNGLYIFYDSRGHALYVGKAKRQTLWKEMNLAFNRNRGDVQSIKLVSHPIRNQEFIPAHEQVRQPKPTQCKLHDLACYFSAYLVNPSVIDDLEALLVRGFANDLLNIKMERFENTR